MSTLFCSGSFFDELKIELRLDSSDKAEDGSFPSLQYIRFCIFSANKLYSTPFSIVKPALSLLEAGLLHFVASIRKCKNRISSFDDSAFSFKMTFCLNPETRLWLPLIGAAHRSLQS